MSKKITFLDATQEFIKRGYEPLFGEEFYRTCNNATPLPYRCPHHPERENKISLANLKSGCGCAKCANEKKKTTFLEAIQEFINRGYEPLFDEEFYRECNNATLLPYRCPRHPDRDNKISLNKLKIGQGCAKCAGKARITYAEAIQEFIKRGYEPLFGEEFYRTCNNATPLPYRCPHHPERENKISLGDLKGGHGCAWCSGTAKIPFAEAIQEFINRGYEPLFDEEFYKKCNNKTTLPYRCLRHPDHENNIRLNDLKRGHGCGLCRSSKMEKMFIDILTKLGYRFEHNKSIEGLRRKGLLRPDFVVFFPSEKRLWIETDGIGHFKPTRFGGMSLKRASEELEETRKKDSIKNAHAKEIGIPIWRVPYFHQMTEDHVLSILSHYTNRK